MRATPGARFLDPMVLARISDLGLLARTVVEGFIAGLHHSPAFGVSSDFAEHRAYMPGDDIRNIDWRAYARTDRYFVKQFEADTNTDFTVVLDTSASMGFASGSITKLDYGRYLAACLAYLSSRQRDRVGLALFSESSFTRITPGAKRLDVVLHELDRATAHGAGSLLPSLRKLGEHLRRRSVVALISDFYEPPDDVTRAVSQLRQRGNDVVAFHVLDPAELDFSYDGTPTLRDMETGETLPVASETLRKDYSTLIGGHIEQIRRGMLAHGFDYVRLDTSQPLDGALFRYLSTRERLRSMH